jgi:hypothetical protein
MAEIKTEYEGLKSRVSRLAADRKGIPNGPTFEWCQTITGRPMLALGNVAAVFEAPTIFNSVSQNNPISIRFSRKPAGSGQAYAHPSSPLAEIEWDLQPQIFNGAFVWTVPNKGEGRFSAETLTDEIAKQLAQYHIEYEAAYGR